MTIKPHQWTDDQGRVLILKRIPSNRKSYNDFPWPKEQQTFTATDFSTSTSCGGGLHGWPWMFGLGEGSDYDIVNDVWLVLAAKPDDVVGELEGGWKCKAKTVDKIYDGDFIGASALLKKGQHECIIGMASSGEGAKLASSGEGAKLASSGYGAKLASSGDRATLASSGYGAKLASSGDGAKACAGKGGAFALAFTHPSSGVGFRVGKVGRQGIKAGHWYMVDLDTTRLVECDAYGNIIKKNPKGDRP